MSRKFAICAVFCVLIILSVSDTIKAIDINQDAEKYSSSIMPHPMILALTEDSVYNSEFTGANSGWLRFMQQNEGPWWVRVDKRTGLPAMVWGRGVPWIPGNGNNLSTIDVFPSRSPDLAVSLADLEIAARDFLEEYNELFRARNDNLILNHERSMAVSGNTVWFVDFDYYISNIKVLNARIFFRINNGNLIQFGTHNILDPANVPTDPVLKPEDALVLAMAHLEVSSEAETEILDAGSLYLVPVALNPFRDATGTGDLSYRLIYRVSFRIGDEVPTWISYIDALTGETIALYDNNRYSCYDTLNQGQVKGGVFKSGDNPASAPHKVRPFPYTLVIDDGTPVVTDFNGLYPFSAKTANSGLNGEYFDIYCYQCTNPTQAFVEDSTNGDLNFGTGGLNINGNGFSTSPERNTFYHLNIVWAMGKRWLPTLGWLDARMGANVNYASTCNAFWNGTTITLYQAGGGCNNTGDIPGVIQHEWGHGIDQNTTGGPVTDGARGEGLADTVAMLASHDYRVGPYFFTDGRGVRCLDYTVCPRGLLTLGNVNSLCPGGSGPMGAEVHCEGEILGQTNWDLSKLLVARYNQMNGWMVLEHLVYESMPTTNTYVPNQPGSSYDGYIAVDDDNGNLADGTPNAADINSAFLLHQIQSTPMTSASAPCTPPTAPPVTATPLLDPSTGIYQVLLNWTGVPGASYYNILRREQTAGPAYLPVAFYISPPTVSFLDTQVSNGLTYDYIVQVVNTSACVSTNDNHVTTTLLFPEIILEDFTLDDSSGNGNGFVDPGETIVVPLTVRNTGIIHANNTLATMEVSHPDITIIDGTFDFGRLNAGSSESTTSPHFSFSVANKPEICGHTISVYLFFESDEGCWASGISFVLGGGKMTTFLTEDFESDTGWTVGDPSDTASTGIWVRTDPDQTDNGGGLILQPGDDHTPDPGVNCWVTGNGPGGGGSDDVDGGCTTLYSPVYDLSSYSNVFLSYWRWYTNETALDDDFVVEISNNGGGTWVNLETVTSTTQPWTQALFSLDNVFTPAPLDQIKLRFIACDEGAGSLTEALIDDLVFSVPDCDAPVPSPKLEYVASMVDDGFTNGKGNSNGRIQPGETIFMPVILENVQNVTASSVTATLAIKPPVPGIVILDKTASYPNIAPSTVQTSLPPHFSFILDEDDSLCGTTINFELTMVYMGGSLPYSQKLYFTKKVEYQTTTIYSDNFDGSTDNGWTHDMTRGQDDWQRGVPQGKAGDPSSAYSPANVWGNDLGGSGWNGEYRPDVRNYLDSPVMDCTGRTNVHMKFQRWLTVEDATYDQARIRVNGTLIWENPSAGEGNHIQDTQWTLQEFDISSIADDNPSVQVRFELRSDGGLEFGGWNIDNFAVYEEECFVFIDSTRPTNTPTPLESYTPSPAPTNTPVPTNTAVPTDTPTGTPTLTPTNTRVPLPVPAASNAGAALLMTGFGIFIAARRLRKWSRREL